MRKTRVALAAVAGIAVAVGSAVVAVAGGDPGQELQDQLEAHSDQYFGVTSGLPASSTKDIDDPAAPPLAFATLAKGLSARVVTSGVAAPNLDMGALWPVSNPKWLLYCNEQGTTEPGPAADRPRHRRGDHDPHRDVLLRSGAGHAVGHGRCSVRRPAPTGTCTRWSTRCVTGATIDRTTGAASRPADRAPRTRSARSRSRASRCCPNGVTYYGDELRRATAPPAARTTSSSRPTRWSGGAADHRPRPVPAAVRLRLRAAGRPGQQLRPGLLRATGTWQPVTPTRRLQLRPLATGPR